VAALYDPRYNKSTAFTDAEREALGLRGLLPPRVFTMEEQLLRVRRNFDSKPSDIEKYIFLVGLQDRNETLFYRLVTDHLAEMLPILYTPTVGEACRRFGHLFRRPRGLYLSLNDRGQIRRILDNWPDRDVAVIVVTDGERILGLGDLGAHGMGIPIGKLALYTACAGVPPHRCLPITLDVGTDNEELRSDPLYTGLARRRLRGAEYDAFVEEFVVAVEDAFPTALLQWEDFATENAIRLLERYGDRLCTFNDDIQGTAAVTLAALLSASRAAGVPLIGHRVLFLGAGASATGVAGLLVSAMEHRGLAADQARERVWLVDSRGLVVASRPDLADHKRPYAHAHVPVEDLVGVVDTLRPSILIGLSAQAQAFSEPVLRAMAAHHQRPIVFALSNPTSRAECTAEQAYRCTDGRVLFASGSPFEPLTLGVRRLRPSQVNNAYTFPGLGLGVVVSGARRVSEAMFHAAAETLAAAASDDGFAEGALLPPIETIRAVSVRVATAVVRVAVQQGLARVAVPDGSESWVESAMYQPRYPSYA
jgi:malate dehydrogenase (oxaloacetate-decarboxylating)(NADP+)